MNKASDWRQNMYIIVGLGNPKKEYENTRHNIGFDVIDAIANEYNISMSDKKHKAIIGKGAIGGQKVILAKPITKLMKKRNSLLSMMTSVLMLDRCVSVKKVPQGATMVSRVYYSILVMMFFYGLRWV